MKILIFGDIHANLAAAEAVLEAAGSVDQILCVGDLVSFGPDPAECVGTVREVSARTVQGNHDLSVLQYQSRKIHKISNSEKWLRWTREQLSSDEFAYLEGLPEVIEGSQDGIPYRLIHWVPDFASYQSGIEGKKVMDYRIGSSEEMILFFGHCHQPGISLRNGQIIVSTGSVGQPRDGDWRASFVIWEDREITIQKTEYDVEQTISNLNRVPLTPSYRRLWAEFLKKGQVETEKLQLVE